MRMRLSANCEADKMLAGIGVIAAVLNEADKVSLII